MKINYNQILIGQNEYGDLVTADIKDGKISCLNQYCLIMGSHTYDGNNYLECIGCGGDEIVNGVTYKRGMEIAEDMTPFFDNDTLKEIITSEDFYEANGSYCSECGTFHDMDQYHNVSFTILNDCELYCKDCVGADDLIAETPVNEVDDIYNAKDITGMNNAPESFEEVHTIFHDCGWGGPATNHNGAETIVNNLMEEHGELYAGLTGIGQFQVYVTLYKKVA